MPRMIDQIRASKLPSNMMQFAARGALQVPSAENIEILVHLAVHNKVFGELARMTLAGWDEKSSLAAASDPQTPREVLDYFIAPDNMRPKLLPALLENPSVPESQLIKLATSAMRDTIEVIVKSKRAMGISGVVEALKRNPYLRKEDLTSLGKPPAPVEEAASPATEAAPVPTPSVMPSTTPVAAAAMPQPEPVSSDPAPGAPGAAGDDVLDVEGDQAVTTYMKDNAAAITAEGEKRFQSIGGVVELLGQDFFPVLDEAEVAKPAAPSAPASAASTPAAARPAAKPAAPGKPGEVKRENTMQKINGLDVKGRIQLALKGNKEERSILIRDGTKVVALAVLEAPKLSDGEVEKFASQKNVLEAVLRQIPLKRRFMKNYIVVRNLCANPRTPLDLGLGLMKNLMAQDLKNISANKEVSETIRKLAMKMYKQKMDEANKK
jgi:hypothetical protein